MSRPLTLPQLVRLSRAAAEAGALEQLLLLLLAECGLRVREVVESHAADFRDERNPPVLHVRRKRGERFDVPLAPTTAAALSAHLGERRHGPLLLNPTTGDGLRTFEVRRIVMGLAHDAGLGPMSVHAIRRRVHRVSYRRKLEDQLADSVKFSPQYFKLWHQLAALDAADAGDQT